MVSDSKRKVREISTDLERKSLEHDAARATAESASKKMSWMETELLEAKQSASRHERTVEASREASTQLRNQLASKQQKTSELEAELAQAEHKYLKEQQVSIRAGCNMEPLSIVFWRPGSLLP